MAVSAAGRSSTAGAIKSMKRSARTLTIGTGLSRTVRLGLLTFALLNQLPPPPSASTVTLITTLTVAPALSPGTLSINGAGTPNARTRSVQIPTMPTLQASKLSSSGSNLTPCRSLLMMNASIKRPSTTLRKAIALTSGMPSTNPAGTMKPQTRTSARASTKSSGPCITTMARSQAMNATTPMPTTTVKKALALTSGMPSISTAGTTRMLTRTFAGPSTMPTAMLLHGSTSARRPSYSPRPVNQLLAPVTPSPPASSREPSLALLPLLSVSSPSRSAPASRTMASPVTDQRLYDVQARKVRLQITLSHLVYT